MTALTEAHQVFVDYKINVLMVYFYLYGPSQEIRRPNSAGMPVATCESRFKSCLCVGLTHRLSWVGLDRVHYSKSTKI